MSETKSKNLESSLSPFGNNSKQILLSVILFILFDFSALSDEKLARMGIVECTRGGVTNALDVSAEKDEEVIASFMYTVLVTPTYNNNITKLPLDLDAYKSEKKIEDPELIKILKTSVSKKATKKSTKEESAEQPKAE